MKTSLFTWLCFFILLSCNNRQTPESLTSFIPADAAVIIQTSNIQDLQKELHSVSFLGKNILSNNLEKDLSLLKYTDSLTESLISISVSNGNQFNYTIITRDKPHFSLDSIQNKSLKNIKTEGLNYRKLRLGEKQYFLSKENRPFIISTSENTLRQILIKKNNLNSEGFNKAYKAIAHNNTSLILNHARVGDLQQSLVPNLKLEKVRDYAGWSAFDLEISKNGISFNGLSIPQDETNLHQIFRNTSPVSLEFAEIVPRNSGGFVALGYKNPEIFLQNLQEFSKNPSPSGSNNFLVQTREAGIFLKEKNTMFVLKTLVDTEATDLIQPYAELEENYRDYSIYKVKEPEVFQNLFTPLFSLRNIDFVVALDQYLVFAGSPLQLRELIGEYVNKNTMANDSYYRESMQKLAQETSILIVGKSESLKAKLVEAVAVEFNTEMKNLNFAEHKLAVLQLVEEGDFAHLHGHFKKQDNEQWSGTKTEEILSVRLEADLLNEPVLIKNHMSNQMDIAVQDINNTLYLISNKGTIFWKKNLSGPILGEIKQIDKFKNGKLQIAYATPYSIEVLDRNGNPVKPFPLKFNDEITQPLSLFDYDNNRKYRFLITQNDKVFMYDKNGKNVRGFDFKKTDSEIIKAPKHIRIQNKDYIVFPEKSGKLNILSRQGDQRVRVEQDFDFSENMWYEYGNDFISTNVEGDLITVTQKGGITNKDTNYSPNHRISARPDLMVSLSENILEIKNKKLSLNYGLYTVPKIFYVSDKYFIGLTDLQSNKIYLFNSNGVLLPGFPVYGTSGIDLNNTDIDQRLEFTVRGDNNEVLLYKL